MVSGKSPKCKESRGRARENVCRRWSGGLERRRGCREGFLRSSRYMKMPTARVFIIKQTKMKKEKIKHCG